MQEQENKAVEKTKKAQSTPKKSNSKGKSKAKKQTAIKKEKQEKKQELRAERERILAEKRVEKARIKSEQKKQKQKAKQLKKREKAKHKAELKKHAMEKKAEKNALKEQRKKETKTERQKRLQAEKQEKLRLKREKRELKAEVKKKKIEARKAKRQAREKNKTRGFGGWLAAVISLGVSVLVLSSVLTMTLFIPDETTSMLGGMFEKSYYDTVTYVDNMDMDLSKTISTTDEGAVQKYLLDIAVNSELAENDLGRLPLHDEDKFYTTKLVNQIGDYAKYLNNKIINGEGLSSEDYQTLQRLYEANKSLKLALNEMSEQMGAGYDFTKMMTKNSVVTKGMKELQNLSADYPELIYDGPFSDGQANRQVKGLSGEEITPAEAEKIFTSIFNGFGITDVKEDGETEGRFKTYNFTAMADDHEIYAQITKQGGKLIMFDWYADCTEVNYEGEDLIPTAKAFLEEVGYTDMEAVWISSANGVASINFAWTKGDVIVYSDLIKVTVCQESGKVTGLEASGYLLNHTDRNVKEFTVSLSQASGRLSDHFEVLGTRKTLIPATENLEKIAYEFKCEYNDELYYVYIDGETCRQIEMFKVISSKDGDMLI